MKFALFGVGKSTDTFTAKFISPATGLNEGHKPHAKYLWPKIKYTWPNITWMCPTSVRSDTCGLRSNRCMWPNQVMLYEASWVCNAWIGRVKSDLILPWVVSGSLFMYQLVVYSLLCVCWLPLWCYASRCRHPVICWVENFSLAGPFALSSMVQGFKYFLGGILLCMEMGRALRAVIVCWPMSLEDLQACVDLQPQLPIPQIPGWPHAPPPTHPDTPWLVSYNRMWLFDQR